MTKFSFILASLLLLTSCLKKTTDEVNFGTLTNSKIISSALQGALGSDGPDLIQKDEMRTVEVTRLVRGRPVIDLLSSIDILVSLKLNTEKQIQYTWIEETYNYDLSGQGTTEHIEKEFHECLHNGTLKPEYCLTDLPPVLTPTPTPTSAPTSLSALAKQAQKLNPFAGSEPPLPEMTAFYNFEKKEFTADPPAEVKLQPNCGEVPHCQLQITQVDFEQVTWPEGTRDNAKANKIHLTIKVSKDVPYLSKFLQTCRTGSVAVAQPGKPASESPRFLVTFCETVKNFKYGTK